VRFKKSRRQIVADVDQLEASVLTSCVTDLLDLLAGAEDEAVGQDPLAALVGMPTGDVRRPEDPALARLFPDAYADDDEATRAAAAEFRRYTEGDLRAGKRGSAGTVLATLVRLGTAGGKLQLDREEADAWLGCLNDLRLVLGTRLEVTEETDVDDLADDDPRAQALHVYGWLGWLQESLLTCLMSR
jgi:Domain of unknown function (DUF2017)